MAKKNKNGLDAVIKELEKRAGVAKTFSLDKFCFPAQLKYIQDPSRFKTACTSRRAGKTTSIAAEFIDCCLNEKNVLCLYITVTSRSARQILWPELKRLADEYKLNIKTDDTRMEMTFIDTGSIIRLGGAKDEAQCELYRGLKVRKCKVDEGQSFRPYLTYLVNDILMPALRDLRGDLSITGTPGPIPAGAFYDYTHSELWSSHHWDAFSNPFMLNLEQTLAEERAVKGINEQDPGYIRETYGRWVYDPDALVFKFTKEKNIGTAPEIETLEYIFGIDIGFNDSDAIAVLGYSYVTKNVYLVEELIKDRQDISSLVNQIKTLQKKYKPVRMVMDAGALGKKIQEEITQRHGIFVEAADKARKVEFIELLNDDLRTGKFKAKPDSRFEQDCYLVQWDRSQKTVLQQKLKISDSYHSDINDAVLYAWRECRHFLAEALPVKPAINSIEWFQAAEERAEAELAESMRDKSLDIDQDDIDFITQDD
jgi:hypothetical protein